jgi:hypothetical protein
LAVLLRLDGRRVVVVGADSLSPGEVLRSLALRTVIPRRHGLPHRGETHCGSSDLVARTSSEVTQRVRTGYKRSAPLPEGVAGLTHPVDVFDMTTQLVSRSFDRVTCIPQSLAARLQVLRIRLLHQIDHLVELIVFEVCTATQSLAIRSRLHEGTNRVNDKAAKGP